VCLTSKRISDVIRTCGCVHDIIITRRCGLDVECYWLLQYLVVHWRAEEVATPKSEESNLNRRLQEVPRSHSEEGVDLTLIRWMLSLSPEQRVRVLEDNLYALTRLKNGTITT
jgi:hypothetical protein